MTEALEPCPKCEETENIADKVVWNNTRPPNPLQAEVDALRARVAELESKAARLLEWWPENSENGPAGKAMGDGFSADVCALRAELKQEETK